ncbi:MAG: tyrosine--tRNA ligase [Deltaproteobacteria bacterium RBG_13_61_14]|nr:MAG: tyrosine--tRNA ligase [Deltaproteobacteria bacterium RBG_13_61_14]
MEDIVRTLETRGFLAALTDPEMQKVFREKAVTLYAGFDPTAPSLHVGNLLIIMGLAQFQRHGHTPIVVVGGGTGLIGDPSGKTKERQLLSQDELQTNLQGIRKQLERFLAFGPSLSSPARILNNAEWLLEFKFLDFLRDVGKHFRLGEMLAKESVKLRLNSDEGMSFTEFCYQLLQAYDFLHLFDQFHCTLQVGGSDQWGNITAGIDLIRKLRGKTAYGITFPLLTTASGEKFGKTEAGTIWLESERTSPYDFYQYFIRTDDRDVIRFLNCFTFLPAEEIKGLEKSLKQKPEAREAQKRLAFEVTSIVHGEAAATKAKADSEKMFSTDRAGLDAAQLDPALTTELPRAALEEGLSLVEALVNSGLSQSKGEARRLINQGGVYVNDERVQDLNHLLGPEDLIKGTIVLRTGKKNYRVLHCKT